MEIAPSRKALFKNLEKLVSDAIEAGYIPPKIILKNWVPSELDWKEGQGLVKTRYKIGIEKIIKENQ